MAKRKSIAAEAGAKNYVPFIVTPEIPFNVAAVETVELSWYTKDDEKKCSLKFLFRDKNGERHHAHYENIIEEPKGKLTIEMQIKAQDGHIAQFYNTFMGDGASTTAGQKDTPLGTVFEGKKGQEKIIEDADYEDFFNSVITSIMKGRKGKPIYLDESGEVIPFWLKLVYDDRGILQVPLFNNYMDLYREGHNCLLNIVPRWDNVTKPSSKAAVTPTVTTATIMPVNKGLPKSFNDW